MYTINKYLKVFLLLTASIGLSVNTYSQTLEESAASNLPLPSVLFEKHIDAVGGEKSLRAHTSKTIISKLLIKAMGVEGDLKVVAAAPNKIYTTMDLGQYGKSHSGYNGKVGWSIDPMAGNIILEGEALQQMIARADFYANDLHLGKNAVKLETVETVNFEDGEQYKVLMVDTNGEESYLYFSKKTGLLSGIDMMQLGTMGKMPAQIRMSNYVEFEDVKTAGIIKSTQNGVETIIEINSVSYNPIDENAFDLPNEIKTIVSQ